MTKALLERFLCSVNKTSTCWLWTCRPDSTGYGQLRVRGKKRQAHRISWKLHRGEIPEGLYVLHRCDVRNCVNPEHLFLGTQQDNMDDMYAKGRAADLSGESNGRAKLTAARVEEMRHLYAAGGWTQARLATRYGVAQTKVSSALLGDTWPDVPGPLKTRQVKRGRLRCSKKKD